MKAIPLSKAEFDTKRAEAETLTRDWAERECTSFDQAVRTPEQHIGSGSIWQMPAVDSKRVVSLLVELEPILGCKLPPTLIRRGGYMNPQILERELLAAIRDRCSGADPVAAEVATETHVVVAGSSKDFSLVGVVHE